MQTSLPDTYRRTPKGRRAEDILRSCVHCGFCNATCPTYQVLGDELDGPRGRIYLLKEMFESQSVSAVASTHLDRCLTCRACETTCPSGVAYGELLELGRDMQTRQVRRGFLEALTRRWLLAVVPRPERFRRWAALGRRVAWLLPTRLRQQLPRKAARIQRIAAPAQPVAKVLLLQGCVQRVATPEANAALTKLLAKHHIAVTTVAAEGCCGSLSLHLGEEDQALRQVKANLQAMGPLLQDHDAVISTASGCGVTLKDYQRLLDEDDELASVAYHFVRKVKDVSEYLAGLGLAFDKLEDVRRVAVHIPCTLQHGQGLGPAVAQLLADAGYELVDVPDAHLCCGSAGTYSLLQPALSEEIRQRKLENLQLHAPDVIVSANVGCQMHLGAAAGVPVRHWLELLQ